MLATTLLMAAGAQAQFQFSYTDFSDVTGVTFNGDASQVGNTARLTPPSFNAGGSFFHETALPLKSNGGAPVAFSTVFEFTIFNPNARLDEKGEKGGDGFVFIINTQSNMVGSTGGFLGFAGLTPSVGIEFDTWFNENFNGMGNVPSSDLDSNHMAIVLNGDLEEIEVASISPNFVTDTTFISQSTVWNAWVDYDGTTLSARTAPAGTPRPAVANVELVIDLEALLGQDTAFVGFSAGTGSAVSDHRILSWEWVSDFDPFGAGGEGDPHFTGFNGEKMDLTHGTEGMLQLFCLADYQVDVKLSATPDEELYMTTIYFTQGDLTFSYGLFEDLMVDGAAVSASDLPAGMVSLGANQLVVEYNGIKTIVKRHQEKGVDYLNVNMMAERRQLAGGLLGQTLLGKVADFEKVDQFVFETIGQDCVY